MNLDGLFCQNVGHESEYLGEYVLKAKIYLYIEERVYCI